MDRLRSATPVMSEDSLLPFELPSVARKNLSVGFDGGQLSSDAGVLVLRGVEKKLGLAARLASCIRDRRQADQIHRVTRGRGRSSTSKNRQLAQTAARKGPP